MDEDQRPLHVTHIACGRRHCMAALDYGAFFYWGDNVSGQLGNRKRSFLESPFPKRKFELHHNVIGLAAGLDSSAVIVQSLPDRVKKNKYPKRVMSLQELQEKSAKAIEDENMAKLDIHKKHDKKLKEESGTRVPMDMRFRNKLSSFIYGTSEEEAKTESEPAKAVKKQ